MSLNACFQNQSVMKASYVMKAARRALTHNLGISITTHALVYALLVHGRPLEGLPCIRPSQEKHANPLQMHWMCIHRYIHNTDILYSGAVQCRNSDSP